MQSPASQQFLLGQNLQKQGLDTSPILSNTQGFARLAQALAGGLLQRDAQTKFADERAAKIASNTQALTALGLSPTQAATLSADEIDSGVRSAAVASVLRPKTTQYRDLTEEELSKYSSAGYPEDLLKLARVGTDGSIKFPPKLAAAPKASLITLEKDGEKKTLTAGAVAEIDALIGDGWVESRTPAVQVNTTPTGYEPDPDNPGSLRPIVGGPADKLTKAQTNAAGFADRVYATNLTLSEAAVEQSFLLPEQFVLEKLPGGNFIVTAEFRRGQRAANDFISAVLRPESGAAISDAEYEREYKKYIPAPGDDAGTLAEKRRARERAFDNIARDAGPRYKSPKPEKVEY